MKEQPKAKPLTEFQQYVTKTSKMLLIGEIVRARSSLGEGTTPEGYQQLADTGIEELMNDSNILRAAVALAREALLAARERRTLSDTSVSRARATEIGRAHV